jgi:hypothetical protein
VTQQRPELRIVDQATWDAAQVLLGKLRDIYGMKPAGKKRGMPQGYKEHYPKSILSGIVYCYECGTRLYVSGSGPAGSSGTPPPAALARCRATVIGVGAIGRQVALQLTAIGISTIQLVDHNTVEPANLACHGFFEDDIGKHKVNATAECCRRLNRGLELQLVPDRFRRSMDVGNFCGVDSIETRRLIWEAIRDRVSFFCDGRMTAETIRVVTACDAGGKANYPTTLFSANEAYRGSCTAKSTIYCSNIAAGLMLSQFTRWLRGFPTDHDVQFNLLASEVSVHKEAT